MAFVRSQLVRVKQTQYQLTVQEDIQFTRMRRKECLFVQAIKERDIISSITGVQEESRQ